MTIKNRLESMSASQIIACRQYVAIQSPDKGVFRGVSRESIMSAERVHAALIVTYVARNYPGGVDAFLKSLTVNARERAIVHAKAARAAIVLIERDLAALESLSDAHPSDWSITGSISRINSALREILPQS